MPTSPIQPGDNFLLFHRLPYDFNAVLPLSVGPRVYLENTPHDVLGSPTTPSSLADYVLPGYNLPGSGSVNCCLRSPGSQVVSSIEAEASDLFFRSITALRLYAPLPIEVAGQFKLGSNNDLIQEPALYQLVSPWQPNSIARYSGDDIDSANAIAVRLSEVLPKQWPRLGSAIVLFAQVTCGHSKSLQMAYLALFSSLEALFPPRGNYASTLACRVARFLCRFQFPGSLSHWLQEEYRSGRNDLAHGGQGLTPLVRAQGNRANAFGRLHEITRLCILGFLSLSDSQLESHSIATGTELQNLITGLGEASGKFIGGQRFWL